MRASDERETKRRPRESQRYSATSAERTQALLSPATATCDTFPRGRNAPGVEAGRWLRNVRTCALPADDAERDGDEDEDEEEDDEEDEEGGGWW